MGSGGPRGVAAPVALVMLCAAACGGSSEESTVFEAAGFVVEPGTEIDLEEHFATEAAIVEAAAGCMREQGWPYQPWSSGQLVAEGALPAPPLGTPEFAAERGYGHFAGFEQAILTHPAAKQDPNQVFVDGLSYEEKFVYYQTLFGVEGGDGVRREGVDEELYREGGCIGRERQAIGDGGRGDLLGSLFLPFQQLQDQVNADPRLLAYDEVWSECMAGLGFEYESSPQARASFEERYFELWGSVYFPASAYSVAEIEAMTETERAEVYALQPEYDRGVLERGLAEEIEVAVADAECQGDDPRWDVFVGVLAEFEDQFVADHQAVFDELADTPGWP